jgi:hypothetical protein
MSKIQFKFIVLQEQLFWFELTASFYEYLKGCGRISVFYFYYLGGTKNLQILVFIFIYYDHFYVLLGSLSN